MSKLMSASKDQRLESNSRVIKKVVSFFDIFHFIVPFLNYPIVNFFFWVQFFILFNKISIIASLLNIKIFIFILVFQKWLFVKLRLIHFDKLRTQIIFFWIWMVNGVLNDLILSVSDGIFGKLGLLLNKGLMLDHAIAGSSFLGLSFQPIDLLLIEVDQRLIVLRDVIEIVHSEDWHI